MGGVEIPFLRRNKVVVSSPKKMLTGLAVDG